MSFWVFLIYSYVSRKHIEAFTWLTQSCFAKKYLLVFGLSSGFTYKYIYIYIYEALKKSFIIQVSYELTLYDIHSQDTVFWLI